MIFIVMLMTSACNIEVTSSINNQSSVNSPNQTSSIISSVEESSVISSIVSNPSSSIELSGTSNEKVSYLLTGRVVDTDSNGVNGVKVRLYSTTYSMDSTTLENGEYSFSNLEVGTYYLMLMLQDGYELNSSQSNFIVNVEGENTIIQYSDIVIKKNLIHWGTLS